MYKFIIRSISLLLVFSMIADSANIRINPYIHPSPFPPPINGRISEEALSERLLSCSLKDQALYVGRRIKTTFVDFWRRNGFAIRNPLALERIPALHNEVGTF